MVSIPRRPYEDEEPADPETYWQRPEEEVACALLAAEPLASLLAEQLLVLQRIERSLETLMTLGVRQVGALEQLAERLAPNEEEE